MPQSENERDRDPHIRDAHRPRHRPDGHKKTPGSQDTRDLGQDGLHGPQQHDRHGAHHRIGAAAINREAAGIGSQERAPLAISGEPEFSLGYVEADVVRSLR